jgi:alkylmercury lyase
VTTKSDDRTGLSDDDLTALMDGYLAVMPELQPHAAHVAVGLWRRLAEGTPVSRDDLAARLAFPHEQVDAALDGPLRGTYLVDEHDRIRAFWALSLPDEPSPHRLSLDGRTLYAWCAADTLFLPLLLGRPLAVESVLMPTGEPVTLTIHPDRIEDVHAPSTTLVTFVPPVADGLGDSPASIMSTYCHHMMFVPDETAGRRWADERGRDDLVLASLAQAFDGCRRLFRTLLGEALVEG